MTGTFAILFVADFEGGKLILPPQFHAPVGFSLFRQHCPPSPPPHTHTLHSPRAAAYK